MKRRQCGLTAPGAVLSEPDSLAKNEGAGRTSESRSSIRSFRRVYPSQEFKPAVHEDYLKAFFNRHDELYPWPSWLLDTSLDEPICALLFGSNRKALR